MSYNKLEDLEVYILAENLSNEIWDVTTNGTFSQKIPLASRFVDLQTQ